MVPLASFSFLLGIAAHAAALFFKVNRPMGMPIFNGKRDLEYARTRHPIWFEKLGGRPSGEKQPVAAAALENQAMEKEVPAPVAKAGDGTGETTSSSASGMDTAEPAEIREEPKKV